MKFQQDGQTAMENLLRMTRLGMQGRICVTEASSQIEREDPCNMPKYQENSGLRTYFQPSSLSAFSVEAYTAVASPGLRGHNLTGIF